MAKGKLLWQLYKLKPVSFKAPGVLVIKLLFKWMVVACFCNTAAAACDCNVLYNKLPSTLNILISRGCCVSKLLTCITNSHTVETHIVLHTA